MARPPGPRRRRPGCLADSAGTTCTCRCIRPIRPPCTSAPFWLYKSTDAGATFSRIGTQIHVDQHFLAYDPQDPATIFAGNDGGIYKSVDGGTTWVTLNTNLALTQFYGGLSLHSQRREHRPRRHAGQRHAGVCGVDVLAEGRGGGMGASPPSTSWIPPRANAETQWSATIGGPRRSDNGSAYVRKTNGINTSDVALFIPPMAMDPLTPSTLYFGTSRLYRDA